MDHRCSSLTRSVPQFFACLLDPGIQRLTPNSTTSGTQKQTELSVFAVENCAHQAASVLYKLRSVLCYCDEKNGPNDGLESFKRSACSTTPYYVTTLGTQEWSQAARHSGARADKITSTLGYFTGMWNQCLNWSTESESVTLTFTASTRAA